MVTHLTPSCLLICSMIRSCMRSTCGRPLTSGWIVMGNINSSETGLVIRGLNVGPLGPEYAYRIRDRSSQSDLSRCLQHPCYMISLWTGRSVWHMLPNQSRRGSRLRYLGLTQPCELALFLMNIMGGRSSIYQDPGISFFIASSVRVLRFLPRLSCNY